MEAARRTEREHGERGARSASGSEGGTVSRTVLRGARWDIYGSKFYLWVRSANFPKALYAYGCRCAKDATAEEAAKGGKTN